MTGHNDAMVLFFLKENFSFFKECNDTHYGQDCNHTCGHCWDHTQCHHVNGSCLGGCEEGFIGDKCMKGK